MLFSHGAADQTLNAAVVSSKHSDIMARKGHCGQRRARGPQGDLSLCVRRE